MKSNRKDTNTVLGRAASPLMEMFGMSLKLAITTLLFIVGLLAFTVFWSIHSAPPKFMTITTGPPGSVFETNAIRYSNYLWTNVHIRLKILPSQGSIENLERLNNPRFKVDVGFVQGGNTNGCKDGKLFSLGSIYNMPLLVFYRGTNSVQTLSDFAGKRLAIGPKGSGTRALALTLLQFSGLDTNATTQLLDMDSDSATQALLTNQIDAVFLTGDSASPASMRQLLHAPGIQLMDFAQAEGYARRVPYLNELEVPRGAFDFAKDIPSRDIHLIGPTVELIARTRLHPALSDQLLDAAREVHSTAGIFRKQNEFPSLEEHDFPISTEAERYHKSGKTFLYRKLPFWMAAMANFIIVAFLPVLVVAIPTVRLIPTIYKWRTKLIFYRWYRALISLERQAKGPIPPDKVKELMAELDHIENAVNKMRVPASFANDYYTLRGHVDFVRERLTESAQ